MSGLGEARVWQFTRAGNIEPNAMTVTQRAGTFTAGTPDGTVLLTRRDEDGLHHYLVLPPRAQDFSQTFLPLAHAVAARADEVEDPSRLFDAKHLAVATVKVNAPFGRSTQAGADVSELSRLLATSLREGEWVAMVLRHPNDRERKWHQRWLEHHQGGATRTHHALEVNAAVVSLWAGADSLRSARGILQRTTAAMPGFDMQVQVRHIEKVTKGFGLLLPSATALVGGTWADSLPTVQHIPAAYMGIGFLAGLSMPGTAAGVLYLAGRIPSFAEKARRFIRHNLLVPPGRRFIPPARPRAEVVERDGKVIPKKDGGYPLPQNAFIVGPALTAGLVAPHAGADSGVASTQVRLAPAVMRNRIGPYIGLNDGQPVYLSAEDMYAGTVAFGLAGSGKSRLVQALFAWATLERVHPLNLPGYQGTRNSLVVFENKGEGADDTQSWARRYEDPKCLRVDLAGNAPEMVDLLAVPGNVEQRARSVVNALKYTFSDGSIMERSFRTLTQVLAAAFAVTPDLAAAGEVEQGRSPFYYANILLGGRGDEAGVRLAGAIRSEAVRVGAPESTDLGFAAASLAELYEGKTPSQRAQFTDAPRSKVGALLSAENYWSRPKRMTWDTILEHHVSVIINAGVTTAGEMMDDELSRNMQSMLMYTLYDAIKRRCSGWYEQHRAVTIFADELKLLAGSSADVITWIREQGRSYGVRAVFATQNPEQLTDEVRNSVMGFGTLLAFAQNNPLVIRRLIDDLNLAGQTWDGADVANLPPYEVIIRATAGRQRQLPFTAKVHNFWGDQDNFDRLQGYDLGDTTLPGGFFQ
ncbi:type IV secretory system conjugative DNA transfer family protein [Curtobacterium sp. MCBD17_040]|uniref:type IV secretory system conjugative DNA transfer family protein n=1 Tax=Curtobacterium sp. MCBD17_040 TaxID=2175674 RepID=UPI0011B35F3B|nr:type IV secretory system conjugative DNA transfer family protein [Curtobacterium sp. MCBD17_040]WIB65737.1 type IV secretory system conjugative DNA transfer family protein [Curtobacterium sp. MCBD17_040]